MFITAYILDSDIFDKNTPYYVPLNEYCQTYVKENNIDSFALFIFKSFGTVLVLNQGVIVNYISGITSNEILIKSAHELLKGIQVKGFKDAKIFSDEYLDPFSTELLDFSKLNLFPKIGKEQKIKNKNVSILGRMAGKKPESSEKTINDNVAKKERVSGVGILGFLMLALIAGGTGYSVYSIENQREKISTLQASNNKLTVSLENLNSVLLEQGDVLVNTNKKLKEAAIASDTERPGTIQASEDIKQEISELKDLIVNISFNGIKTGDQSDGSGAGGYRPLSESEKEEVSAAEDEANQEVALIDAFSCKVVIEGSKFLTCVYNGKSIRIDSKKDLRIENGLLVRYLPRIGSVKIAAEGIQKIVPVSHINR